MRKYFLLWVVFFLFFITSSSFAWTTGWQGATEIDAGNSGSIYPQIAFDSSGKAFCVFSKSNCIYAYHWDGSSWGESTILGASEATYPAIASGGGKTICVFVQGNTYVYADIWNGSSWSGATRIDGGLGEGAINTSSYEPLSIAFDSAGKAICAFSKNNGSNNVIYGVYWNGSTWGTPVVISDEDFDSTVPDIAFDSNRKPICVYHRTDTPLENIYARRSTDTTGSTWEGEELISDSLATLTKIACDSSGKAIGVFAVNGNIYANLWNGSAWAGAELIGLGSGTGNYPRIAFSSSGNALCVFKANNRILSNYWNGSSWGLVNFIDDDTDTGDTPAVDFDSSGNAVAVFYENSRTSANYWNGSSWGAAQIIDDAGSGAAGLYPEVDSGGSEKFMAVFKRGNAIYGNLYLSGTPAVTSFTASGGANKISLRWTNPSNSDYTGTLILRRKSAAPTGSPTDGTAYSVDSSIGDGLVIYNDDENHSSTPYNNTGLKAGTRYYYKAFAYDDEYSYTDAASANAKTNDPPAPPPTNPQISIDEGQTTTSREIHLTLSAEGAAEMYLSGDVEDDANTFSWITYDTKKTVTLTSDKGSKTVSVKYRSSQQVESETVSALVTLLSLEGSITIDEGEYTNKKIINLTITGSASAVYMYLDGDVEDLEGANQVRSWISFGTSAKVAFSGSDGAKTVKVKLKDSLGDESDFYSDSTIYDTAAPVLKKVFFDNKQVISGDAINQQPKTEWYVESEGAPVDQNSIEVKIDGQAVTDGSSANNHFDSFDVSTGVVSYQFKNSLNTGSHSFGLFVEDLADNQLDTSLNLNLTISSSSQNVISSAINAPNPCGDSGTRISFQVGSSDRSLTAEIKIFNSRGVLTRTISSNVSTGFNSILWDAKNDAGQPVPNGGYFYIIKTYGGNTQPSYLRGKIAVRR